MKIPRRHRLLTAFALGALLATGFSASAEPAAARDKDRKEHRKDHRDDRQERRQERREQQKERREDRREARQERREDRRDARQDRREDRQDARQDRQRQQVRARLAQQHRVQQQRAYQQRVQQQRAYQQRLQRQRVQQARAAQRRAYAYSHDYYSPASSYRYNHGGRWYTTSHYGANVLRQAVQRGYQEGLRAGRSDRYDRWNYNYSRSRIWIDGSYGFGGRYVNRADYAYYFRQGFERGYEDGYYDRGRYGRRVNGEAIIIQAVLEAILGFQRLG